MDICWPHWDDLNNSEKAMWNKAMEQIKKNPLFVQLINLRTAYTAILTSMLTAFVLCVIYIYFMSVFAEYVAWGLVFLTQLSFIVLAAGGFFMFM